MAPTCLSEQTFSPECHCYQVRNEKTNAKKRVKQYTNALGARLREIMMQLRIIAFLQQRLHLGDPNIGGSEPHIPWGAQDLFAVEPVGRELVRRALVRRRTCSLQNLFAVGLVRHRTYSPWNMCAIEPDRHRTCLPCTC